MAGKLFFNFSEGEKMTQQNQQCTKTGWRPGVAMLLAGLAMVCMVIMAAAPTPVQAASKVTEISLNQTEFTPDSPEIKGVAKIPGVEKGLKVTADLIYGPENLKALTITKEAPGSGDLAFDFSFSKPTKGWPQGDYKVVISTSDGAKKEMPFKVK
jgi:hypothetical protein